MASDRSLRVYESFARAPEAKEGLRPGGLALTDRALILCDFPPRSAILDIGCGAGVTLVHAERVHGLRMFGLDRSAALLQRSPHMSRVIRGDACALPFPDGVFDGIMCECVLSLIDDKKTALAECFRALRPGGRLIVTDLYLRNRDSCGRAPIPEHASCLFGASGEEDVKWNVTAAGFHLVRLEDHSSLLKDFAVRIVWSHGSVADFFGIGRRSTAFKERFAAWIRESKPGYFLLMARKDGPRQGR